jgi:hypothetical protein
LPNIEIHGFGRVGKNDAIDLNESDSRVWDIRSKILISLSFEPFFDDVVVTVCPTLVYDGHCLEGGDVELHPRPFLRVYDSNAVRCQKIAEKLNKELRMDVEFLPLYGFFEGEPA